MCFTCARAWAVRGIFEAQTFGIMEAHTADGKWAVTGTDAFTSLVSSFGPLLIPIPNSITLVRGRKGTSTVVAILLPVGQGEGGGVEGGPHQTWPSELLRGGWSTCSWSQPGRSMLHSLVCFQPLFRGCLVITHVAKRCRRDSCHLSSLAHCWRVLLHVEEILSPLGISAKGWGTWLLGSDDLLNFLTPGVQGEGEAGTNGKGEVEGLTLGCQCSAKVHALGDQGGVFFTHCTHFGFTSESWKLESCRKTCCHRFHFFQQQQTQTVASVFGTNRLGPLVNCMQSKSTAGYQSSPCRQQNGVRVKMMNFRVKLKSSGTTRQMFCPWIPIRGCLPVILQAPDAMSACLTALMCIFVYFLYSYSLNVVDLIISMAGRGQRGGFNISGKISHLTASTASTTTLQRWRH